MSSGLDLCFLNEFEVATATFYSPTTTTFYNHNPTLNRNPTPQAPTLLGWEGMTPLPAVGHAEQAAEAVLLRFPELSCVVVTCGVAHVLRMRDGGFDDGAQ